MGYWFDEFDDCKPWRKTPTKINGKWYTPYGEEIKNPDSYFETIEKNGKYWKNNTGWNDNTSKCRNNYSGSSINKKTATNYKSRPKSSFDWIDGDMEDEDYYRDEHRGDTSGMLDEEDYIYDSSDYGYDDWPYK